MERGEAFSRHALKAQRDEVRALAAAAAAGGKGSVAAVEYQSARATLALMEQAMTRKTPEKVGPTAVIQ